MNVTLSGNRYPNEDTIHRTQLPNGIRLLFFENPSSPSVSFAGVSGSGTLYDPAHLPGLGGFLAGAMMRGTEARDFNEIYQILEGSGATLGFSPSVHQTTFRGRMLAEDYELLLTLLYEGLTAPTFPESHLIQVRDQILSGLARQAQDPETMASVIFDKALFGDHPYGIDSRGTEETIRSITRADLLNQHHRFFNPQNTILCVSGGISPEQATEAFTRIFADWRTDESQGLHLHANAIPVSDPIPSVNHHEIAEKSQLALMIGSIAPARKSADYMPVRLGNAILGEFGMMGRIGKTVREDNGMAYYAGSSVLFLPWGGAWEISAGINPANLTKVVPLIREEVKRFTAEKVSETELADVKANLIGSMPLMLQSNAGIASQLLSMELYQLGLDYLQNYETLVNSVTEEIILETVKKYLNPEKLVIASSGTLSGEA